MVVTQGPLSRGDSLGHDHQNASVTFSSDGDGGTPSHFVQAANPWYDIRGTYIVYFVADGCRKNLPLADASRMAMNIKLDRAFLTVVWCDRCQRAINTNDEKDHWHEEQCGGCRKFQKHDSDFGWCKNHESVYCGRLVFEHDTCSKFVQGKWS